MSDPAEEAITKIIESDWMSVDDDIVYTVYGKSEQSVCHTIGDTGSIPYHFTKQPVIDRRVFDSFEKALNVVQRDKKATDEDLSYAIVAHVEHGDRGQQVIVYGNKEFPNLTTASLKHI